MNWARGSNSLNSAANKETVFSQLVHLNKTDCRPISPKCKQRLKIHFSYDYVADWLEYIIKFSKANPRKSLVQAILQPSLPVERHSMSLSGLRA